MADWRKLARDLALANSRIDEKEAAIIRRELLADAVIDKSEMEFLLEIRKGAQYIVPALNQLIFQAVKKAVLADGSISAGEAAWLRRWIMADGKVDDDEKRFLQELKRDAKAVCPEFQALHDECLSGRVVAAAAPTAGRFRRKCQQCAKEFLFGERETQPLSLADQAVCAKHKMDLTATIKVACPQCGFAVLLPRPAFPAAAPAPTASGLVQASQAASPPRPSAPPPPKPAPPPAGWRLEDHKAAVAVTNSAFSTRVGVKKEVVESFAAKRPDARQLGGPEQCAAFVACLAAGMPEAAAREVVQAAKFSVQVTPASRFSSTQQWGELEIYFVQIMKS